MLLFQRLTHQKLFALLLFKMSCRTCSQQNRLCDFSEPKEQEFCALFLETLCIRTRRKHPVLQITWSASRPKMRCGVSSMSHPASRTTEWTRPVTTRTSRACRTSRRTRLKAWSYNAGRLGTLRISRARPFVHHRHIEKRECILHGNVVAALFVELSPCKNSCSQSHVRRPKNQSLQPECEIVVPYEPTNVRFADGLDPTRKPRMFTVISILFSWNVYAQVLR